MNTSFLRVSLVAPAAVVLAALALSACGSKPADTAAQAPAAAPAAAPADATASASTPAATPARTPSPAGASVAILSPRNGDTVTSPVKVVMDIQGMTLAPAGDAAPDTGHHHLLVDTPVPADLSQPIPADEHHIHFGKAQTETEITLAPGTHTLQLLLGDSNHIPHDPPVMSTPITITVK